MLYSYATALSLTLGLSALPWSLAQSISTAIPEAEASVLAAIQEDVAPDRGSIARKGDLSPDYPLIYKVALPIPPIKEPSK